MRRLLVTVMIGTAAFGCAAPAHRATPSAVSATATTHPAFTTSDELDAQVDPPAGWNMQRSGDDRYIERVWVSPTGHTSYGVVHFKMPLPVGEEIVLASVISHMRQSEGEARLLSKQREPAAQNRLKFSLEGGRYHMDGIVLTHGLRGWVVYAGTLRNGPTSLDELELAVQSRENTRLGLNGPTGDVKKQ